MSDHLIDLDDLAAEFGMNLDDGGWIHVRGTSSWRKSLRGKHWAQIVPSVLGWAWTIHRADPLTMCTLTVADGLDISLRAAKDDVDHWSDTWHRHAIVLHSARTWWYACRLCGERAGMFRDREEAMADAWIRHSQCEAAWQRGER